MSVVIGDFNGDAILDLVSGSSNHVSILLGDGSGAFSVPTHLSAGSVPRSVAVGDFNGDTSLDLAVANLQSGNVSILLGDGSGAFSDPTNFRVEARPASVAVEDFNGDTFSDLVVTNRTSDSVSILLGNGTGLFSDPTNFAVGDGPGGVGIGDFNGDSVVDLAVTNAQSDNVSILLGVPSGLTGFQSPPGDDSTLVENGDGTFTHTVMDGTQINFNADGLQTSTVDRNGNTTHFAYDGGERLITLTDPVGLATSFSYGGGLLSSIRDPAGRVTRLEHDDAGNLTAISDADGTS